MIGAAALHPARDFTAQSVRLFGFSMNARKNALGSPIILQRKVRSEPLRTLVSFGLPRVSGFAKYPSGSAYAQ